MLSNWIESVNTFDKLNPNKDHLTRTTVLRDINLYNKREILPIIKEGSYCPSSISIEKTWVFALIFGCY